jgi:hypothetical protein
VFFTSYGGIWHCCIIGTNILGLVLLNTASISCVGKDSYDSSRILRFFPSGIFSTLINGVRIYIKVFVAELCFVPPMCILDIATHKNAATTSLYAVNNFIILRI